MYLRRNNGLLAALIFVADAVTITAAFLLAYQIRGEWSGFSGSPAVPAALRLSSGIAPLSRHAWLLLLIIPVWEGVLICAKGFRPKRTATFFETIWSTVASVLLAAGVFGAMAFALKLTFASRGVMLVFIGLSAALLTVDKCALLVFFRKAHVLNRNLVYVLVVGTGRRAQQFIEEIESHIEWGMRVKGLIDRDRSGVGTTVSGYEVIGTLDDIPRILSENVIDLVSFVIPREWLASIQQPIRHCELQGVDVQIALDLFDHEIGQVRLANLGSFPLLSLESTTMHPWQTTFKRVIDIGVSALLLILLGPVLLAVALAVKLSSPGPVLYKQLRNGLQGREFQLLKFRTMVRNADELLEDMRDENEMSGAAFKLSDDPRVTRVGRFLRRHSLDELPQLINVLKGDMSIVGPRPLIATEIAKYEEWQRRRMSVRPGLTCLWQINGRNTVDFAHWMELDLEYIDQWSLMTDLKIVVKTLPAILHGRGAY